MITISFLNIKLISDHIFVLKCLIEEAKSKKSRIYSCFIDLKKAFDTVWIQGLLYKLVCKYNISPKLCRLLKCMYDNLKTQVYSNGYLGDIFNISIGTRQGCNLSPTLLNLFINDLPSILHKADCDPVTMHSERISILMYADDMILMSRSQKGLEKSLKIVEIYCKKWQLNINEDKTKILIFNCNKYADVTVRINGKKLELVKSYNYLGLLFTNSGSFSSAIKELSIKARRAYFAISTVFNENYNMSPRLMMKLFDTLIKPIATYASEIWGAFGHKDRKNIQYLDYLFKNLRSPYEQLHLKFCKRTMGVSKRTSNIGCLAELGRFPINYNIICAVCNYYSRLHIFKEGDLLYHALKSQQTRKHNSGVSFTYDKFTNTLLKELNINHNMLLTQKKSNDNAYNSSLKKIAKLISSSCQNKYKDFFSKSLNEMKNDDTKLTYFVQLKTEYMYEKYLNYNRHRYISKYRLSDHNLPIERGRYVKPKIPKELRLCTKCKLAMGNEIHVLLECKNTHSKNLNDEFLNEIITICQQFTIL